MELPLPKNAKESVAMKKVAALSNISTQHFLYWLAISYSEKDSKYLNALTGEELSYWRGKQPEDGLNEGVHVGMIRDGRWIRVRATNHEFHLIRTVCQIEATLQELTPTKAPTTSSTEAKTETSTESSTSSIVEYLPSLVDKINDVFENNKGSWRTRLLEQWTTVSQIFNDKYLELADKGCSYSNGIENTVDFDTINTCKVSTFDPSL